MFTNIQMVKVRLTPPPQKPLRNKETKEFKYTKHWEFLWWHSGNKSD